MKTTLKTESQAFFYVDGIPTKGLWIDLDDVNGWEDVESKLKKVYPEGDLDEILCADIEGIAKHFYYSGCDSFDIKQWIDFKEGLGSIPLDIEVIEAYLSNMHIEDLKHIKDSYCGHFASSEDFAWDLLESTGDWDSIPKHCQPYFDIEKYARDLMYDFWESNGHYFRNI